MIKRRQSALAIGAWKREHTKENNNISGSSKSRILVCQELDARFFEAFGGHEMLVLDCTTYTTSYCPTSDVL